MKTPENSNSQASVKSLSKSELEILFEEGLRKRIWAERELSALLPVLSKKATSYELSKALDRHLKITENQISRLLHVFDVVTGRALGLKYNAMETLFKSCDLAIDAHPGYERDAAIVASCTAIMQHEIKVYAKLGSYAKSLGQAEALNYLQMAIFEEKTALSLFKEIVLQDIYSNEAS